MDSVHCQWNGACGEQPFPKPRPIADTLSRLAELMARVEHKQEGRSQKFQHARPSASLASQQQRGQVLCKRHCCQHCGQEFALASTLQLHRCFNSPSVCQMCNGKPQLGYSCPSCLDEASSQSSKSLEEQPHSFTRRLNPNSSYATRRRTATFPPPPRSPEDAPPPSKAFLPPSEPNSTSCSFCPKTFRNVQGLNIHNRIVHQLTWKKKSKSNRSFPCRSCDRVFSQTSSLYLHRKEEHSRGASGTRQQKSHAKSTRRRKKSETFPCLRCGKVFLHHLTRRAHFKTHGSYYQSQLANNEKNPETTKGLKVKQASKPSNESKPNKKTRHVTVMRLRTRKQEVSGQEDAERQEEDGKFPCPSCEEMFETRRALRRHEELHQTSRASQGCSVCTGGITLPDVAMYSGRRVYHCAPCKGAFLEIETFLQHCKTHLHRSNDEERDVRGKGDD